MRKYEFTENEAVLFHSLVSSHCSTLKNHIASYVERGEFVKAVDMVKDLRIHQELFAKTNVEAHRMIDAMK